MRAPTAETKALSSMPTAVNSEAWAAMCAARSSSAGVGAGAAPASEAAAVRASA